jgi:hypothetical protein
MADERTAEQIAADNALTEAITEVSKVYDLMPGEGWTIGDYVVCVEYTGYADDTVGREKYSMLVPGDFMPSHRITGLLRQTMVDLERGKLGDQ